RYHYILWLHEHLKRYRVFLPDCPTGEPRRRCLDGIRCSAGGVSNPFPLPADPVNRKDQHTKREALDHTKMKRLCRRLNIPLYQAVGILETLWQITAKQALVVTSESSRMRTSRSGSIIATTRTC